MVKFLIFVFLNIFNFSHANIERCDTNQLTIDPALHGQFLNDVSSKFLVGDILQVQSPYANKLITLEKASSLDIGFHIYSHKYYIELTPLDDDFLLKKDITYEFIVQKVVGGNDKIIAVDSTGNQFEFVGYKMLETPQSELTKYGPRIVRRDSTLDFINLASNQMMDISVKRDGFTFNESSIVLKSGAKKTCLVAPPL